MENLVFMPFEGIEIISFKEKRETIRNLLNNTHKEYKENEFAENTSDYFQNLNIFIEYDSDDRCNAIVFEKEAKVYFEGYNLLETSYSKLRKKYDSKSVSKNEEEEIGITYYDLGFGFNKVFGKDEIQTLIIFSKDYW